MEDSIFSESEDEEENADLPTATSISQTETEYQERADKIYQEYATQYKNRFKWIRPQLFKPSLKKDLRADCLALIEIAKNFSKWETNNDHKLQILIDLLCQTLIQKSQKLQRWSLGSDPPPLKH